ncbi:unnamed protein product [Symbiodinium natans]|uniref:Serine protease n=1 Tax=Symbiodinium natans TaxID=878477 RepID=A0A812HTB8_9DINO|nr:unnamed protein product [Symbiodinium natans]
MRHPGSAFWSGDSIHGASGFPLLTASGEIAGVNVGAVEEKDPKSAIAVKSSALIRYSLSRRAAFFEKKRFGKVTQPSTLPTTSDVGLCPLSKHEGSGPTLGWL